ncbi:MAG: hypothetical protein U5P41_12255 [Gammaproteobacteria bacterium]|nr:hypothetical protein [Gammaproteobacteria bacterium]
MQSITFIIPDLLPSPAAITENDLPDCQTLVRLLARADRKTCSRDYYQLLFDLFGMNIADDADQPIAPLGYFAESGAGTEYCLRADPVHLSASGEGVVLLDNFMIGLQAQEAGDIAVDLQPYLDEVGGRLYTPHPGRWYITFAEPPRIQTTPLPQVLGRDVSTALPAGPDRTRWRQLFNELQMVLHTSAVNEKREKRGMLAVNSLWFWGLGTLPPKGHAEFDACFSDDPFVRGLAVLHDIPAAPLPVSAAELREQAGAAEHILVSDDRARQYQSYGDAPGWLGYVMALESDWLQPLDSALRRGRLNRLELSTGGMMFSYRRRHQWRLWRRESLLHLHNH